MHVRTLGGLTIEVEPDAGAAPGPGPRRLALLAVLAAAGPRGATRARIIGILWPETDEEQARHNLSQTLYALRRETDRPWVDGATVLRLHESITSDVAQFQHAIEANELERAADLYAGPFLDGFYLPGAPEFEQWVESTRSRLQLAALKVMEALARQADASGRFADAVEWWRRLGEIDPLSTSFAAGRIRSLLATGDRPSALQFARDYEARVLRDLDSEPAPLIAALIAGSEAADPAIPANIPPVTDGQPTGPLQRGRATSARAESQPLVGDAATRPVPPIPAPAHPPSTPLTHPLPGLRAATAVLTLAAAVAIVSAIGRARSRPLAPFIAIGSIQARDTAPLGPLLRDMLSTNLGRIDGIRVVANSRLVELLGRTPDETPGAAAAAARRAGASEIIEGELGVTTGGLVLSMRRVALESGLIRRGYTVRAADEYALTDSATSAIARDLGLDMPPEAAAVRTRSAIAYALYEQGLRAKFEGDGPATHRLMMAALERDPTFAMAAFHGWSYSTKEEADRLLPVVKRLAATAVDRERLFIQASFATDEAPQPESFRIVRELADRYPEDPDVQILFGRALWGTGDFASGVAALDRAVAIDSAAGAFAGACRACAAIHTMTQLYMWWDSAPAAERAARRIIAMRPDLASGWESTVEPLLRQGRRAEAEASIARAARLRKDKPDTDWMLDRDMIRAGRLDELGVRLVSELQTAAPDARGEGPWLLAFVLRNQGRLREAEALAAKGELPGRGTRMSGHHDYTTLAIVALERGDARESARRFLDMVADDRAGHDAIGLKSRNMTWHMTLAATALAAAGDTTAVRALADSVERIGSNSIFARDPRLHHFLRGLLLQHESRHAEAVTAFRHALFTTTDGYTRINLELARSLMVLQRYAEAIAILQPAIRGGVDGSNTYVTHTELHEALARAFTGAGQRDSAAVHWAAVERAWRFADPQFADRHRIARGASRSAGQ